MTDAANRIDHLLDAIELIKTGQRKEALPILRKLIQEDKDFEDAWLWMSVAVDDIHQSVVCLDNVLRINPENASAAAALYKLRRDEMASEERRARLRARRDASLIAFWVVVIGSLFTMLISLSSYLVTG